MRRARPRLAAALAALGVVLLALDAVAWWSAATLADADGFAQVATSALQDDDVRDALAQKLVNESAGSSVASTAVRPVFVSAVSAGLGSSAFAGVFHATVAAAHRALVSERDRSVVVSLAGAAPLLESSAAAAPTEEPGRPPSQALSYLVDVADAPVVLAAARFAGAARPVAWSLLGLAAACLVAALRLGGDVRRVLRHAGIGLVAAAAALAAVVAVARGVTVTAAGDAGPVAAGIFDAVAADLVRAIVGLAVLGVATLVCATSEASGPARRVAAVRSAAVELAGRSPVRLLLAAAAVAVGAACLREPLAAAAWLVRGLGLALAIAGLVVLLEWVAARLPATTERAAAPAPRLRRDARTAGLAALLAVVAVLVTGGVVGAAVLSRPEPPAPDLARDGCNGAVALCDRRIDQVALVGSHNSMSSAAEPGFYYTEQTLTLAGQLAYGVRALLIDVYDAYRDSGGRLRTDLVAKIDLDAVRQEYGPDAVAQLQRLGATTEATPPEGAELRPYLCHIACEIGATDLVAGLRVVHDFLVENPAVALVVIVQDYVPATVTEAAFREAELLDHVYPLKPGETPPTLRTMITTGRQLVVMSENHGGEVSWMPAAYAVTEETPYDFSSPSQFTCAPHRGTAGNPFFLLNHWVNDGVAPSIGTARTVNSAAVLQERLASCRETRGRSPGILAVDFVDAGDVRATVDELNR